MSVSTGDVTTVLTSTSPSVSVDVVVVGAEAGDSAATRAVVEVASDRAVLVVSVVDLVVPVADLNIAPT